ncbi:hypothetical protein [Paraburkholderia sp. RL17-373-BIF-A]|uniref:hypothetical protein n=1 Tax=Paraburkholderia sp. RL17-373-BIF-A TaxID=3031629 RepID=UPI0038B90FCA
MMTSEGNYDDTYTSFAINGHPVHIREIDGLTDDHEKCRNIVVHFGDDRDDPCVTLRRMSMGEFHARLKDELNEPIKSFSKRDADPHIAERSGVCPAPTKALYAKRAGMLSVYVGEEKGLVWGTKVRYLSPAERAKFELTVDNSGLLHIADGKLFDTTRSGGAIFVMDHDGRIFASCNEIVGKFHHSSFLAGAPVAGAGTLEVVNGRLKRVTRNSGHYRPTVGQHQQVVDRFRRLGAGAFISSTEV